MQAILDRRAALLVAWVAILVLAGGCSSSPESVAASPTATGENPETPAASSPTTAPTAVPDDPNATATPVQVAPTATPVPATATAPDAPAPTEPVQPGLLQEQFCVSDIDAPDTLNLRAGPSTEEAILHELLEGQCRIYLTGETADSWREVMVDLPDDEIRGWVSGNFIAPQRSPVDPDEPMVTITITVEYELDFPASQASIDAFRLVDAEGLVVGFLDANGQILVPVGLDLSRARIEAEWADDPYCAWTGQLRFEGAGDRYSSPLEAICA